MVFIKAHRKQFLLAGSLAVAVTAFTVTACGGGSPAPPAQGAAPGQWTKAEVSQFTAAGGGSGSDSQDSCIIGYFERDMSFGNAMAAVSIDPASGASLSTAQVKAALVSKYGTTQGDVINAQFEQTVTDSDNNCAGSAASSTAPAAAPVPTADPAAAPVASTPAPAATTPALVTTTPAAASAVASASVPSTDCIVPDVIGAGLNGHIAAAAAENEVSNTCPPVGYHVVTVLTVSGPAGTPQGELWKESPAAGSSEPPGSTVTLYFQP